MERLPSDIFLFSSHYYTSHLLLPSLPHSHCLWFLLLHLSELSLQCKVNDSSNSLSSFLPLPFSLFLSPSPPSVSSYLHDFCLFVLPWLSLYLPLFPSCVCLFISFVHSLFTISLPHTNNINLTEKCTRDRKYVASNWTGVLKRLIFTKCMTLHFFVTCHTSWCVISQRTTMILLLNTHWT